jgi:hypothetical protein
VEKLEETLKENKAPYTPGRLEFNN